MTLKLIFALFMVFSACAMTIAAGIFFPILDHERRHKNQDKISPWSGGRFNGIPFNQRQI